MELKQNPRAITRGRRTHVGVGACAVVASCVFVLSALTACGSVYGTNKPLLQEKPSVKSAPAPHAAVPAAA